MITVVYQVACEADAVPSQAQVERWVSAALAGHRGEAEVAVRVVTPAEGRRLNSDYRGRDYATNVLSFPFEAPPGLDEDLPELGDLVICAEVVSGEAAEQGKPPEHHWAHMVVHGTLHLLGYDHMEETDALEMEETEQKILAGLGIPDPYREEAGASSQA